MDNKNLIIAGLIALALHAGIIISPSVTSEPEVIFKKGESSLKMNLVPSAASVAAKKSINDKKDDHKVEVEKIEKPEPLQKIEKLKVEPKVTAKPVNNLKKEVAKVQEKTLDMPKPLQKPEHLMAKPVAVKKPVNEVQKKVHNAEDMAIESPVPMEKPEQLKEKQVKAEDEVVKKVKKITYSTEYFKPDIKVKDKQTQKQSVNTDNSKEVIADIKAKGVTKGAMIKNVFKPSYPYCCKRKGHEGTTVLEVTVLSNGKRGNIGIIKSAGCKSLDKAAIKALNKAKYIPAKRLGVPFTATKKIAFNFKLEDYR